MKDVGFIGLGTMGRPMASHILAAGYRLFLHDVAPLPPELIAAGGIACESGKQVAQESDAVIVMVPDTPHVEAVLLGSDGVAEGLSKGMIVVDMSSISPLATKEFARKIVRWRSWRKGRKPDDHGWWQGTGVQHNEARVRKNGQERHARWRQWRRPNHQGCEPDHRGADHRGGERGLAICFQGRRRSCAGAPSVDGRLCVVPDP